jgi:hypothetical protein
MHILQANFAYDGALADPDALLDRYRTLTGWSEALVDEHTVAIVRANGLHSALSLRLPRSQTRHFAPAFIDECMQSAIVGAKQSGRGAVCSDSHFLSSVLYALCAALRFFTGFAGLILDVVRGLLRFLRRALGELSDLIEIPADASVQLRHLLG